MALTNLCLCCAATDGAMDAAYHSHRGSAAMLLTLIILTNFTMGFFVPNIRLRVRLVWSAFSLLLQAMVLVRCPAVLCIMPHHMLPAGRCMCCAGT